jgi:hypothetical protein
LPVIVREVGECRDAKRASGQRDEFSSSVGLLGRPSFEDLPRQRPIGKVVEAGEVSVATGRREASLPKEMLEYSLGIIPIPPGPPSALVVAGGRRQ